MRILIIEDEKKIAGFLKKGLEEENFSVDIVHDGNDGIDYAISTNYDCILLDILLPSVNGIAACRKLREAGVASPILMLSALSTTDDKVLGLNSGADDYVTKPFEFEELLARIRSLMRRRNGLGDHFLKAKNLSVNLTTRKVVRGEENIELTNKEFGVLEYLMRNKNKVVTRTMLIEHVWNYSYESGSNVVDVQINLLRNKIDKNYHDQLIRTIRGVGYMLQESSDSKKRCVHGKNV